MSPEDRDSELKREMYRLYEEPKEKYGYNGTYYLKMLEKLGSLETARRLAGDPKIHAGLIRLQKHNALHLSVEALVLRERWRDLFDDDVRKAAREKLRKLGYSERGLGLEA
jgi:hypothetical protein